MAAKIQIGFLTFGSNKGFHMVNVGHFTTEWSICLSVLFLLCKIAFVLFVEISVLSFCKRTFRDGRGKHIFPVNYSLRLFRCRNNAKNLKKGLLSSS